MSSEGFLKCSHCGFRLPPNHTGSCPKCGELGTSAEAYGYGSSRGTVLTSTSATPNNVDVIFPQDFLLPSTSLDDVPAVKLWSAKFFVNQLCVLWSIGVPVQFPNRLVLVSLLDAIMGEVCSAKDALRKKLTDEIRSKKLKPWKRRIFDPLDAATSDDNWLARVIKLRNNGLHGSYLPENIRIGGSPPLDLRLVGYENGIVRNTSMPEDFKLVCQKLEELIQTSRQLIETSLQERMSARDPAENIQDWFENIDNKT